MSPSQFPSLTSIFPPPSTAWWMKNQLNWLKILWLIKANRVWPDVERTQSLERGQVTHMKCSIIQEMELLTIFNRLELTYTDIATLKRKVMWQELHYVSLYHHCSQSKQVCSVDQMKTLHIQEPHRYYGVIKKLIHILHWFTLQIIESWQYEQITTAQQSSGGVDWLEFNNWTCLWSDIECLLTESKN